MKAWGCSDDECGVIVFAATRGKARTLAHQASGCFDCAEWTEISVTRIPALDGRRDAEYIADWYVDQRMYYESGWYSEGQDNPQCTTCGLYEYAGIPESHISDWDEHERAGTCEACKAAGRPQ